MNHPKFEYKRLTLKVSLENDKTLEVLNKEGQDGWLLVQLFESGSFDVAYLVRDIRP